MLERPHFSKYASANALLAFIDLIRTDGYMFAVSAEDKAKVVPHCRDTSDDIILALAVSANADVIVSSDNDLLTLHPWRGISILTPAQFLDQFRIEESQ